MRQIFLDTETTGLEPKDGHRLIEIGCVEMINRRLTGNNFHQYLNPETKKVDHGAFKVHGISNEFLQDKPTFHEIKDAFIEYIRGAEVIIHNAPFDVGFIQHELLMLDKKFGHINEFVTITDTLVMAREMHPGQRNSLDALCKRYDIDNTHRQLHGALLDSQILAQVYIAMTSGQDSLFESSDQSAQQSQNDATKVVQTINRQAEGPAVLSCSDTELETHKHYLAYLDAQGEEQCVWSKIDAN